MMDALRSAAYARLQQAEQALAARTPAAIAYYRNALAELERIERQWHRPSWLAGGPAVLIDDRDAAANSD